MDRFATLDGGRVGIGDVVFHPEHPQRTGFVTAPNAARIAGVGTLPLTQFHSQPISDAHRLIVQDGYDLAVTSAERRRYARFQPMHATEGAL